MASSWIKVEVITPDKPEIFQMADALGIDPDAVLGKLVRIWTWADQQTVDGNAGSVTKSVLDRLSFVSGFADALISVGWLTQEDGRLFFPNFERHNGDSSKKRALTNRRVTEHRKKSPESNAKGNAGSVTSAFQKALPEEEEEEDIKNKPPLTPPKPKKTFPYPDGLNAAAWDEWKQYRRDMKLKAYAPTPRSEGAAITNLLSLSAGDPQRQEEIIRQSMANGWHGLFALKANPNGIDQSIDFESAFMRLVLNGGKPANEAEAKALKQAQNAGLRRRNEVQAHSAWRGFLSQAYRESACAKNQI